MLTRRRFIQGMAATAVLGGPLAALPSFAMAAARGAASTGDAANGLARYVDVFVGTGGHGHTFPGATMPFGMVQLSPDTNDSQWDGSSGYHQGDGSIMGFSHTHLVRHRRQRHARRPGHAGAGAGPVATRRPRLRRRELRVALRCEAAGRRQGAQRLQDAYQGLPFALQRRAGATGLLPRPAHRTRHPRRAHHDATRGPASLYLPEGRRRPSAGGPRPWLP